MLRWLRDLTDKEQKTMIGLQIAALLTLPETRGRNVAHIGEERLT